MSRRTKLLIAACFLVPLLLLGIYVALTWAPVEPLHFRTVMVDGDAPRGWRKLEFIVENRSYVPVHLIEFQQSNRDASLNPASFGLWMPDVVEHVHRQASFIPARGEARTWRIIRESELKKEQGHYWMQYVWVSRTRERFYHACYWLNMHRPSWLGDLHLPQMTLNHDATTITVSGSPDS